MQYLDVLRRQPARRLRCLPILYASNTTSSSPGAAVTTTKPTSSASQPFPGSTARPLCRHVEPVYRCLRPALLLRQTWRWLFQAHGSHVPHVQAHALRRRGLRE